MDINKIYEYGQKNMKFFNTEEKELFEHLENTNTKPLPMKEKERMINMFASSAINTLSKKKAVSLRLQERDLSKIKVKAAEEGIPYQTLMTSVLHKYISKKEV